MATFEETISKALGVTNVTDALIVKAAETFGPDLTHTLVKSCPKLLEGLANGDIEFVRKDGPPPGGVRKVRHNGENRDPNSGRFAGMDVAFHDGIPWRHPGQVHPLMREVIA